jgi:hypothetical protein
MGREDRRWPCGNLPYLRLAKAFIEPSSYLQHGYLAVSMILREILKEKKIS